MPSLKYKVRVAKEELVFSSGHFITYNGDHCEPIHGHNYRVAVEVEGPLDGNFYVFDFILLRDLMRGLAAELDHRMLLPDRGELITIEDDGDNWQARYKAKRWSFPKDECVLLPVPNTTAELIATYLVDRLRSKLADRAIAAPEVIRVEVEECFGQWGSVEWTAER